MATYATAAQANELIKTVAMLNNNIVDQLQRMMAIRTKLAGLTSAQRDTVRQAVADMGYDAPEIESILNRWATVETSVTAQALVKVETP